MSGDNVNDGIPEELLALWQRHRMRALDSSFFRDDRFVEWIAREERMASDEYIGRAFSEEDSLELAQLIQSHVSASKVRIARVRGTPQFEQPRIDGSPAQIASAASKLGFAPLVDLPVAAGVGRELWDEDASSWVKLPGKIPNGSYVALKVNGDSMLPLLHSGDVMVVRLDSAYSSGDVVVARLEDGSFVVKRVGSISPASIELLSVNPQYPSIRLSRSAQPVVGRVVLCWCEHNTPPR